MGAVDGPDYSAVTSWQRSHTLTHVEPRHYDDVAKLLFDVMVGEGYATSPRPLSPDEVAERWAPHGKIFLALGADDDVLGILTLVSPPSRLTQLARNDEAEIRFLVVSPQARGLGIARALVDAAVADAVSQRKTAVVLSTQVSMKAAQRLYERVGFQRLPALTERKIRDIF